MRVEGRFIYLGRYGSQTSHDAYATVVAAILAGSSPQTTPLPVSGDASASCPLLTVRSLASRYMADAEPYYVKNGKQTAEVGMIRLGLDRAVAAFGDLPACEFGPLCLETNEELWESSAALNAAYEDWSTANGSSKAKRGQIKKRLEADHGCKDCKRRVERAGGVSQLHGVLGVRLR